METKHRNFLEKCGAMQTPHSGRSFFEHLKGVHDLLVDWGNDEYVCLAGLYHSIYGNAVFTHKSLESRAALAEMIGERGELLVHYFNTKKRPYFEDVEDKQTREDLLEIEAANLIEQEGGSVKTLRNLSMKRISAGAKAALIMEIALR